jgi:tight adherence protein C
MDAIIAKLLDPAFIGMIFAAFAATAAVLTVATEYLDRSELKQKMSAVALERDKIRVRERERLTKQNNNTGLRATPKAYMKQVVDQFNLGKWLGTDTAKLKLAMAGYRGPSAEVAFLFFRLVTPICLLLASVLYVFVITNLQQPFAAKVGICILATYLGMKGPEIFLSNITQKRQLSIKRAFPDALDLLLICCESGMSIEHGFRKVSNEIGSQSVPLAEELMLATAELSFLSERRQAFENLSTRTGLEGVRSLTQALIQAEKYGTPIGNALRVLAQENRDQRMNEAEKKAAALPPKLTVPMILFFLPVLFAVILTPALIGVFNWK